MFSSFFIINNFILVFSSGTTLFVTEKKLNVAYFLNTHSKTNKHNMLNIN